MNFIVFLNVFHKRKKNHLLILYFLKTIISYDEKAYESLLFFNCQKGI